LLPWELRILPFLLFCSLVSQHPRQARQIKAKEAEIIGLWNDLKVRYYALSIIFI